MLIIWASSINAQGFLHRSNTQIVNGNNEEVILRGMGLGGWMLQEGYMMQTADFANTQHQLKAKITELIGNDGMQAFYDAWLANYITEKDVDSMAAWGFNSIRLPLHYDLFTPPIQDEPDPDKITWLQKGFDLTDNLLSWCKKNQIYLILDLHAAPGGQGKDQGISDYDPSKPSLWEDVNNRKKTVSLWKKLAERYANEEWIGGYDLINETNWDLPNNTALKNLYKEITDSIRLVDQNHLIFIEGNWFANDFTGLTPRWDDNMAYSFHKYWTFNDKKSIQWMLDIRNTQNVPIWLGESGENSNTWFNECIKLVEDNKIGWAWWPWKKIGSISGPYAAIKTPEYDVLLNYWKGSGSKPTIQYATDALMQMAENLKIENCEFHPDVIDAMFRQVNGSGTKPYAANTIPGVIFAPDFDMGKNKEAYKDNDVANYHLSTNSHTAWNRGWVYRNDGVDIEVCADLASNGYNVGFTDDAEWMQHTVNTSETAVYKINVRVASTSTTGLLHFSEDGADICSPVSVPATGGWQNWQTFTINNVLLNAGTHQLKFIIDKAGFNVNGFEFIKTGQSTDIQYQIVSAITNEDGYTIHVHLNKPISAGIAESLNDFKITINGTEVPASEVKKDQTGERIVDIKLSTLMKKGNTILLSYSGNTITATDGTLLANITDKQVENTIPGRFQVPAKIQAEEYYFNNGLSPETCTDTGGGIDLGYTDAGDYLDYLIDVVSPGVYAVNYRVAALSAGGQIEMQLVEEPMKSLHVIDIPGTGGWQTWTTVTKNVDLPAGQHILRLLITKKEFNLNWFEFDFLSGINSINRNELNFHVFPIPAKDKIYINSTEKGLFNYQIISLSGKTEMTGQIKNENSSEEPLDISKLSEGNYILRIQSENGISNIKLVKSY